MNIFKRTTDEKYVFHSKEAADDIGNYDYSWEKTSKVLGIFNLKWIYKRKATMDNDSSSKKVGF